VAEAHDVLSNPLKRREYDSEQRQQQQKRSSWSAPAPQQRHRPPAGHFLVNNPASPYYDSESAQLAMERRELEREVASLKLEVLEMRRAETERHKRRESEMGALRRAAVEARAERDRIKLHWEDRLAAERSRHERERAEDASRIAHLLAEVAELTKERERSSAAGTPKDDGANVGASAGAAAAPMGHAGGTATRSVEKDAHGNYVVVERNDHGYTVSAERFAAERGCSATTRTATGSDCLPVAAASALRAIRGDSISPDLLALLRRLGLDQFCERLEDEEVVSVPLLRSMGPMLPQNMMDPCIGMDREEASRLGEALGVLG
jgi:hypothetical protein